MTAPQNGVPWGAQMRVPRWGPDYNITIAGGVTRPDTLDHGWIGVYPNSGMPGQVGNFSMAAHRTTWGKPFNQVDRLRLNDAIVTETEQGWYTYRFRTLEYVTPDLALIHISRQAPEWRVCVSEVPRGILRLCRIRCENGSMPHATHVATLHTNHGDIVVNLYGDHAPRTVKNFVCLLYTSRCV